MMRTAGCGYYFGAAASTVQENVTVSLEAAESQQAQCMKQICRDEDLVLRSMESACERNRVLRETRWQLQERKRQLEEQLQKQGGTIEALQNPQNCAVCGAQFLGDEFYCRMCGNYRSPMGTTCSRVVPPLLDIRMTPPTSTPIQPPSVSQSLPIPVSQPSALYSILPLSKTYGSSGFTFAKEVAIHTAQVHGVAMGKSSDVIATASSDRSVKLFNLRAHEVTQTLQMAAADGDASRGIYAVAFSKTANEFVGCASPDQSVYLWNHQTGRLNHKFNGHARRVNCIDFHATQEIMATGSSDCRCIVWDVQEGVLLRSLDAHSMDVYGCTFLGQENQFLVATGCLDQHARVFDMRRKTAVAGLKEHTANVIGMDFCWQKNMIATGSDDGTICVWDTRTWTLSRRIDVGEGSSRNEVKRVAFSPTGDMIAAGSASGQVLVYGTDDGSRRAVLEGHRACTFDVAWGVEQQTDAKLLVSASHDHTCRVWRVAM